MRYIPLQLATLPFDALAVLLLAISGGLVLFGYQKHQQAQQRELKALFEAHSLFSSLNKPTAILEALETNMASMISADLCLVWLAEPNSHLLRLQHPQDQFENVRQINHQDMPLFGRVLLNRELAQYLAPGQQSTPEEKRLFADLGVQRGLLLPLQTNQEAIGVALIARTRRRQPFSDVECGLAQLLLLQAATAIQNARRLRSADQALRSRMLELDTLGEVSRRVSRMLAFDSVIEQVVTAAGEATGAEISELRLLEQQTGTEQLIARHQNGTYSLEKTARDGTAPPQPETPSQLAVPIILGDKQLGSLQLRSTRRQAFGERHAHFLASLAEQAAIAIQNARLFEATKQQTEETEALRELALHLLTTTELDQALRLICERIIKQTTASDVHIFLYDEAKHSLHLAACLLRSGEQDTPLYEPAPGGVTFAAAEQGQRKVISAEAPTTDQPEMPSSAWLSVPVQWSGSVVGVINASAPDASILSPGKLNFFDLMAAQAAAAIGSYHYDHQIRTVRDRLQAVLDSINDGIMLLDTDGRLILSNPRLDYLLNIRFSEFWGQNFNDILRQLEQRYGQQQGFFSLQEAQSIQKQALDNRNVITRRSYLLQAPQERALEELSSPVIDEAEQVLGRLFIIRDVTQAYEMEVYREELSSMIVHDLRSPLSGIIIGLQFALEELAEERPQTENDREVLQTSLDVALSSARSLLSLVEALLDIQQLEASSLPLDAEPLDLVGLARNALDLIKQRAQEAQINLIAGAQHKDIAPILGDHQIIERVFSNLLDNALRYTPNGGTITVAVEPSDTYHTVSVIDSGQGIAEELRSRIFERFVQGDTKQRKRGGKGSGLGLTFCKLAVEAHGGRIWVDDGPTGGAAFHFTLPTAPADVFDGRPLSEQE